MNVEQAKKTLKDNGFVMHFWTDIDVQETAKERIDRKLTKDELNDVMSLLEHQTDANNGINWDAISEWIYYVTEKK